MRQKGIHNNICLRKYFFCSILCFLVLSLPSCNPSSNKSDTATQGKITILADDSFAPILQAQEYIFDSLYDRAHLNFKYLSEGAVIQSFLNDTSETIITGRKLNVKELDYLRQKKYSAQQTLIGFDALVLIVNKEFPDTAISYPNLKNILTGKVKAWNELKNTYPNSIVKIAVDKSNSSNLLTLQKVTGFENPPKAIFATGSSEKVIDYVRNNRDAIGVIGWSYISDDDDPQVKSKLVDLKILSLGEDSTFYPPSQVAVRDSLYPLAKPIYSINKGTRAGLGSGFTTFMASDRGQRIILKMGLVPSVMPGREVEITN